MKIFVDENIPLMTVQALLELGHEVSDARGTPDQGKEDFILRLRVCMEADGFTLHKRHGQAQLLHVNGPRAATVNVRMDAKGGGWWGFTKN